MKQALNTLKRIEQDAIALGESIRNEGRVCQAELEERQRLGLHGDAAIKHYNEWMQRYGMEHLMVKTYDCHQCENRRLCEIGMGEEPDGPDCVNFVRKEVSYE